ncbi:type II toxin-antitoxin system VapC family toxin [Halanaerobium sp. ST460_2HS_T2]|uniref:type II toxin-antitoxin system VapC family toxin n=1 Tax=Halanaerobium sp. ST460_2HS_T2 TaxID=2183914 RepID=UPI000DF2EF3F|nr:PIN domain-containing protein [Halanaerobium sp. ST460_2HS_T2]
MKNTLVDAGPLIALFDKDDIYHQQILEFLKSYNCHLYTTWPVITETLHMLSFSTEVQLDFLNWLDRGGLNVLNFDQSILKRVIDLTKKYNDLPVDFADASLLAVAEKEDIKDIISIDSDFNVYKTEKGTFLKNIFISN